MSGTSSSLTDGKGSGLPQPMIRIIRGGPTSGAHDRVEAGGLTDPAFDAIADLEPQLWLYRYKRGFYSKSSQHSGYSYDNVRGYVHPSHWTGAIVGGRKVGGGSHTTRGGGPIPARSTEWVVTAAHRYDAMLEPELWFLNNNTLPLTYPIQPIATATGNEHGLIGRSGQHGRDTGTYPTTGEPGFCGSSQIKGTHAQWFAFAYAVRDMEGDSRDYVVGPLSEVVRAEIWPRVKVNYGTCLPRADRGRKIRLRHA